MKNANPSTLLTIITFFMVVLVSCQSTKIPLQKDHLNLVNRAFETSSSLSNAEIALNNELGAGLAILKEVSFSTGTIEIELQGADKPGQSFVGVAFNIQNDSTYEAIYFRPFNFQAKEKIRRKHSVQYISLPKHDWRILRTEQEGVFEAEFFNPPNPNDWFSISIKITEKQIIVIDKKTKNTLLTVNRLPNPTSDKIALWTGHNSKGKFKNLQISR